MVSGHQEPAFTVADDDLAPVDLAEAGHDPGGRRLSLIGVVGDEQADLQEPALRIAELRDAFARGQLPLLVLSLDPIRPAAEEKALLELANLGAELAEPRGHASCRWRSANHSLM
jgi:hypothetical protein